MRQIAKWWVPPLIAYGASSPISGVRVWVATRLLPPIIVEGARSWVIQRYLRNGQIPHSPGYDFYKVRYINHLLATPALLERFRRNDTLPPGHGVGLDERCVEYPWVLAHLENKPGILLDAGAVLNYAHILEHSSLQHKIIHIMTLAPEANCFWYKGISYLFHDLRHTPIREAYYDTITCLSTLEHVGCDNVLFTKSDTHCENRPDDFVLAMREMGRILKADGTLFLTVPFGTYQHLGAFQQFDDRLLSRAIEAFGHASRINQSFYRYTAEGWVLSNAAECAACEYVEWVVKPPNQWPRPLPLEADRSAGARAVACIQLTKG